MMSYFFKKKKSVQLYEKEAQEKHQVLEELEKKHQFLIEKLEALNRKMQADGSEYFEQQKLIKTLRADLLSEQNKNQKLIEENISLNLSKSEKAKSIEVFKNQVKEINSLNASLNDSHENQKLELQKAQNKISAQQDEISLLEVEHNKTIEKNKQINEFLGKKNKKLTETTARLEDLMLENQMLVLSSHELNERIEVLSSRNLTLEKYNKLLIARWQRIKTRMPSYVDFGGLAIDSVDTTSSKPYLHWRLNDYLLDQIIIPDLEFYIVLDGGDVGIQLESPENSSSTTFFPGRFTADLNQKNLFANFSNKEFSNLTGAIIILSQLEKNNWNGIEFPANFDPGFWFSSISMLIKEYERLPSLFRYDEVILKQEVNNSDYEHIWLSIEGVNFNKLLPSNIEIRVGAPKFEGESFSRFPKLEFPLIDGKVKPFESWFPESTDNFGPKYELRFDNNKKVFDLSAWSKISSEDRVALCLIIDSLPKMIQSLSNKNIAISREWNEWIDLLQHTIKTMQHVLEGQITQKKELASSSELRPNPVVEPKKSIRKIQQTKQDESQPPPKTIPLKSIKEINVGIHSEKKQAKSTNPSKKNDSKKTLANKKMATKSKSVRKLV